MDSQIKPLTKFQKDFDRYLKYFDTFIVDGNIYDENVVSHSVEGGKEELLYSDDLASYFNGAYRKEYVICTYDFCKGEGHRFQILNDAECATLLSSQRRRLLKRVLGIHDELSFNPDQTIPDKEPTEEERKTAEKEEKETERIETFFDVAHSNEGLSLDMARLSFALNNVLRGPNGDPLAHFFFIFLNASRFSLSPGTVQNEAERQAFSAIGELARTVTDHKLVFLAEKMNDLPAWLENERFNLSVKKLTVALPDETLRSQIIADRIDVILDKPYVVHLVRSSQEKLQSKHDHGDSKTDPSPAGAKQDVVDSLVKITSGFPLKRIDLFLQYLASDDPFDDKKPLPLDKALTRFIFGTNNNNPWDSEKIFQDIASIDTAINDALKGQEQVAQQIKTQLGLAVTGFRRVSNPKAPRAVLFLAGPTGTGKTEVTKIIAKTIFGSAESMIRFDMSEFAQEHTDQRLFGAPPGYIGFDAGGELTNAVSQNPFSLILFDEIEKAHPRILDKFLQILSDGRLTDGQGKTVSFENAVIVMTSNAGLTLRTVAVPSPDGRGTIESVDPTLLEDFKKNHVNPSLATVETLTAIEAHQPVPSTSDIPMKTVDDFYQHLTRFVKCNLSYFFAKELNRKEIYGRLVDSIVVYNYIASDALAGIVNKEVKSTNAYCLERYALQNATDQEMSDKIKNYLVDHCKESETRSLGGRGIIKKVDELYGAEISEAIVEARIEPPAGERIERSFTLELTSTGIVAHMPQEMK